MRRHRLLMLGLLTASIAQGCLVQIPGRLQTPISTTGAPIPAAGLVGNNAGTLTGTVTGPSASLIANNAGSLISNNGGGLISNNGGGYRVLADERLVPVSGAAVSVADTAGKPLTSEAITTDARGAYTLKKLKPSGPLVVVTVRYTAGTEAVILKAVVPAPRQGAQAADVTPATSLVAKKVTAMLAVGAVAPAALSSSNLQALTTKLQPIMSDKAIALATLTDDARAAQTFDAITAEAPAIAEAARAAAPALATKTPEAPTSTVPSVGPAPSATTTASTTPASAKPSAAPSTATSTAPGASPTPTPSPTPRLRLLAGSTNRGYTEATGGDLTTARFNEFAGMAYDGADQLYVADESGSMVRLIHLAAGTTERIAGSATAAKGFSGDGGPADQAKLSDAHGVAISSTGDVYVCDKANQRVRVIHANRTIDTAAGGGTVYGDGPGANALLGQTQGIAAGANGVLFFTMRTISTAYENVVRLNADHSVTMLTDKALISNPGAIAVDKAKGLVYFTNLGVVKVIRNAYATPGAPEDVFTVPASGQPVEVRGLALDAANGFLYAFASNYSAANNDYGTTNGKLYRIPLGADGLASGAAVAIAGSGGSSATPADYALTTIGVLDPLTQLISGGGSGMLEMGPAGTLFIGSTYKTVTGSPSVLTQWTEILTLKL